MKLHPLGFGLLLLLVMSCSAEPEVTIVQTGKGGGRHSALEPGLAEDELDFSLRLDSNDIH